MRQVLTADDKRFRNEYENHVESNLLNFFAPERTVEQVAFLGAIHLDS